MWKKFPKETRNMIKNKINGTLLHSDPADVRIPYGNNPLQFGDLRLPQTNGLHPVAIIIHGGCWLSTFADLKNTAALANSIRKMGISSPH
ncbi:MAG: hypothetical protein P4M12_09150 [Gammaproteobacteria bacterium]|nr:hypothetical protein [Gammaproteobacteria bacterium]